MHVQPRPPAKPARSARDVSFQDSPRARQPSPDGSARDVSFQDSRAQTNTSSGMLVWAYHPKLRPVAVAVVAIAVVVAVEAVDKWESYSWCRASPAFAPTQPLPLSWAVSVLSRGFV